MKIKRYVAGSMHEALRQVKAELGPEAVIIGNRLLPRRGWRDFFRPRQIEVTAAVDESPPAASVPALPEKKTYFLSAGSESALVAELRRWHSALREMEFQEQRVNKLLEEIKAALSPGLTGGELPAGAVQDALQERVVQLVKPLYSHQQPLINRICVLIGPTGVGKTTTAVKLAVRLKNFQHKNVLLIALTRSGYHNLDCLKYHARLSGIPLHFAESTEKLVGLVEKNQQADCILIDTCGIPARSVRQMLRLRSQLDMLPEKAAVILVLSSTTKGRDLFRLAEDFRCLEYEQMILTKLDETDSCGAVLEIVCRHRVPVTHITFGQDIPDDIAAVDAQRLAAILI
ncbi:MAG: DEAD/DEAH box helicase family protein, partial [Bacillota bacterium]